MSGLYETDMDPEMAREAVERLGAVLLLEVPSGTQFGMDSQVFVVGEKFKGVKMIPPGVHFLSTNSISQDTASAAVSFFREFSPSCILIRKWNSEREQLEEIADPEEEERWRRGVRSFDFDDGLAPYDISHWQQWKGMSGWIDQSTIDRLMNGASMLSVAEEARGTDQLSSAIPSEAALIAQLRSGEETTGSAPLPQQLNLAKFPKLIKRTGCTAEELSAINLDKTSELREILHEWYAEDWKQLLGEMQFCFVAFLLGQSLQSLEQWKLMLHLLLGCYDGVPSLPALFKEALRALRHQLAFLLKHDDQSPAEVAELLSTSFLKTDLIAFLGNGVAEDSGFDSALRKECQKLVTLIKAELEWDIEETEDDEYAPVIVT